jgi:hypothetical protein
MTRKLLVVLCAMAIACGKKEEDKTTVTSAPVTPPATEPTIALAPPPPTTPAAPTEAPIEVSPEMQGFLRMLDGSDGSTRKALARYASRANVRNDLGMYALRDPKVTKSETIGVMQCYTFDATAGSTRHVTRVCWDSAGKIAQITDMP